jgi:hypothetical protein
MVLLEANSLLGPLEGVGPEITTFLGPLALALLFAISGPKKVSISGRTPYNGPCNEFSCIKIIMSRISGTFIVIIDVSCSQELWWCLVGLLQREAWPI